MNAVSRFGRSSVVLTALLLLAALAVPARADVDDWEFDGGGWGHGVGLSQFGAYGQAQDGRTASQILEFYYTGTSVEESPLAEGYWLTEADALWVGLISETQSVDIEAVGGPVTICQPAGTCPPEPPYVETFDDITIDPGELWRFEVDENDHTKCRFRKVSPEPAGNLGYRDCDAALTKADGTDVRFEINGKAYAHGSIRFTSSTDGFHVVNQQGLEDYLYGLAEMPSSWPSAALEAQAIIGRSFAIATAVERGGDDGSAKLASCGCHIRASTSDQAYSGWSKEDPANQGDRWKKAVDDTAGQVLTHPDSNYPFGVAKAFYSSSNGGSSENVEDVWGGEPLPWLRAVEDPWSADPAVNPLAHWAILVNTADVATYLGWDKMFTGLLVEGPPGAVIHFTGKKGGVQVTADLNGTQIRSLLNSYGFRADGQTVRVSPYISGVIDPPGFNDIDANIFEDAIKWLAFEDITVGCNPPTNTLFCPEAAVSRGEMAVFISRALHLPSATQDYFTDDDGLFYENAANKLAEAGITTGCGVDRFCGEEDVSREQMAAFLARAFALPGADTDYFTDDDGSVFEKGINKIAQAGITVGCNPPDNDHYCPTRDVTRGQMAAFFKRALTG